MKKRILFVNPPQNVHYKGLKSMYPSGALVLMATMCQNEEHNVKIFDGAVDNNDFSKVLIEYEPDIVCITINTFQTKYSKEYLNTIKIINENILTVIGGPHVSAIGLESLSYFSNADIAVVGEGEFTVLDIVNGKELKDIPGICYDGKQTALRPPTTNLDHVPLPNLDLVDLNKYSGISDNPDERSMFIMASRGCPFGCTYCNKSIFGSKVRFRSPEKIIDEIKWLHEKYDITHIYFQDDTFNLKREWIEEILNLIIDNGLNKEISYMAPFRANEKLVDSELLALCKKANFKTIFYGVESGNQQMLDDMHKGLKIPEIKRAFKLTHKAGVQTVAAFIIGLPGETTDTIKDTFRLWKDLKPTYSGFTIATPFPNTKFENQVKASGHLLNGNYDTYRCGGNYVRTDELTNTELDYYNSIATIAQTNEWIYKLPIFTVGKNKLLCSVAVLGINVYRKYIAFKEGLK